MSTESRSEQLQRYIARSRRTRMRAILVGAAGLFVAVILGLAGLAGPASLALALVSVTIAGAGAWITWGHLQEFEKELRSLRRSGPVPGSGSRSRRPA
jgi:hypothetical protein